MSQAAERKPFLKSKFLNFGLTENRYLFVKRAFRRNDNAILSMVVFHKILTDYLAIFVVLCLLKISNKIVIFVYHTPLSWPRLISFHAF